MRQDWNDLLFAHWPVPKSQLQPLVPRALEVQEHDGTAWVGLVPFYMTGVSPRFVPDVPGFSAFPEVNVRLYVECEGKPGLWFLSLDASNALAVWAARRSIHLPYHRARIGFARSGGSIAVDASRDSQRAVLRARYEPLGSPREKKSALERFLTERYCLYTQVKHTLLRCDVHHWPWALQDARLHIDENSLLEADALSISGVPALTHFSRRLEVVLWNPVRVSSVE